MVMAQPTMMMAQPTMMMAQPMMQPQVIQQPMMMNPYGTMPNMQYAQPPSAPLSPTPSSVSTVIDNESTAQQLKRSQHVEENITEINRQMVNGGGGNYIERVEVVDYDTGDILDVIDVEDR